MQIISYPRLYQIEAPGEGEPITSQGDQSVVELYRIYEKGMQDTLNLNFRFRVIDCALRLFGDIHSWMVLQRNNPNLFGYNVEFLRDTMHFVVHGYREMSPCVWLDLVSEKDSHTDHPHHLTLPELALPKTMSTPELLQLWCSHKNGFEDLLQTLFVLFGPLRGPYR